MPVTEAGSASATLDRPSTVGNVAKSTTLGRTYNQAHVPENMKKVSGASAFIGPGAIHGKPIAMSRHWITASQR